ncbi:reticulocyte-binding protein homolog 2a-like isoform X3 [Mytilus edulis]|uniref:reticulocyte-binding protein homolog 2a-like isoform X3 n=1 Tax=Mytilus edulis TaxID=6550 RepID=UPI0039F11ABD
MLSPLSRGFGTWTGNYDPYNEDGAESDTSFCSLPGIEEPHRHGITVGFVSRTPSATLISPPYGRTSSHAREATLSASTHYAREATLSGKRNGPGREVLFADPMSRENSDSQMNLPKTFLTRKGALMLFAADEGELDSLTSRADVQPRVMRIRKPVDVIDTSLKLGTMDKLAMSVLQFGEEETQKENSTVTDEKNKMYMKFLNKVDDRDVDKRAQPGGDVKYYLSDLKHKTSLQMGLSGDTALPRNREALELRAILLGLQGDGSWPMTYRQTGADFKRPSNLAEQFSRPAAHLHHPPRHQNQRILSSDKLEDSVQSLRSYLGRSLDNENGVPLLTRRRAKHKEGDIDSVKRSKYARETTDEDFRRHRSHRPHTNTPTRDQGIVKVNLPDEEEEAEIDEHCLDAKSSSRDDGYHSVSQGDSCSFILGPRNWTPVNSQTPAEEVLQPKTPSVDMKKMVDKGSIDFEDSEDEGLDGEGIVVGFAQDSDDSDVEIIYSTGSHIEVPDNTLDTVEGFHSNDISVQTHSVKSLSPDLILSNHDNLSNKVTNEIQQEVKSAIVQQEIDSKQDIGEISGHDLINIKNNLSEYIQNESNLNVNNIVATDCDDIAYGSDPEFIASDGESVEDLIENEVKLIQNQKSVSSQDESLGGVKPGSASSHKHSMSRASSMHSTFAHDDDQSSVTILPHDQDLISVDVKSAKSPTQSVSDQSIAQEHVGESQITDLIAPTAEAESQTLVKDTDSLATGDDVTSTVMSMGEDTTSVTQQLTDIHGDDEESRDKLGEIIDPRLPRDDRGRIEMIDNDDLNLHFTKTSTPFPPPTPTNAFDVSESSASNNWSPVKDESIKLQSAENQMVPDSTQETVSPVTEEKQINLSENNSVSSIILEKKFSSKETVKNESPAISNGIIPSPSPTYDQEQKQDSVQSHAYKQEQEDTVQSHVNNQKQEDLKDKILKPESKMSEIESIHAEIEERIKSSSPSSLRERSPSQNSMTKDESSLYLSNIKPESTKGDNLSNIKPESTKEDESGIKIKINAKESETAVLVKGDNLDETPTDNNSDNSAEIPHPTTPRSTDIATEDKVSPRPRSESSSKLGEKIEEDVDPETLVSIVEDKFAQKKAELPTMPTIPDYLKPKTQAKQQSKPQAKKDQKKKGQITKVKKEEKTTKTPADVSKAIDITSVQPEEQDEITQIIKKKVTLPPENEHSVMPDFVTEALNRSKERSRLQLEEEFAEKQRMIEKEIGVTSYEGEGMTVEELELEKKELKKREELAKEKLLKGKPQKKMDEKSKKSGGSSSVRSKKSKGGKDPLQMEKERIRALKEQEKLSSSPQRMEEIRALEEKIAAQSNSMSADDKKFKDKLQEVQMELERIEREAYMAEQTEADVRQALREERMKRMEEKAKLKKEELARKRQQLIDRKQQEKQLKEEARQRELQKIMMLMDDEERKKRQEEERLKKEEDEKEEEKKRKEMEEEFARQEREEEDRRRALEEEIEQEELRRIQVEQDEIRKQQEVVQAQKEALLEEQRRKRELAALEEQRQVEELDRKQQEELKRQAEERARINELLQLEEEVRERMKQDTEKRREEAIQRRDTNIDAKSNLNKIRHSQGINRAFVYSYFINWPIESYMRPIGEQEKKKKEAKLREKRKKAR